MELFSFSGIYKLSSEDNSLADSENFGGRYLKSKK